MPGGTGSVFAVEVGEDLRYHHSIFDAGDNLDLAAASLTGFDVDVEDPLQALCPGQPSRRTLMSNDVIGDKRQIREIVDNWIIFSDSGDWDRFAECWHEDGFMAATWSTTFTSIPCLNLTPVIICVR